MKVYIKNKLFSFGGSSTVVDENKNPVFEVKGKVFSITRKKFIKDLEGNTLFSVRNKWFNWFIHKTYIYDANKEKIAMVKDKFFNYNREFFITGYKDEIKVNGNFFSLTSQILKNEQVIGTLKRQITFVTDAFELEGDEKDMPFLIALVISIDNITDKNSKSRN